MQRIIPFTYQRDWYGAAGVEPCAEAHHQEPLPNGLLVQTNCFVYCVRALNTEWGQRRMLFSVISVILEFALFHYGNKIESSKTTSQFPSIEKHSDWDKVPVLNAIHVAGGALEGRVEKIGSAVYNHGTTHLLTAEGRRLLQKEENDNYTTPGIHDHWPDLQFLARKSQQESGIKLFRRGKIPLPKQLVLEFVGV